MATYLWVALGSALGGVARFACSNLAARWLGEEFPWGTLAINVLGSFVIGLFAVLTGPGGPIAVTPDARRFVMVGVCGGYTTFSAFSLHTFGFLQAGDLGRASLNIVASVTLCVLATWAGFAASAALAR